MDKEGALKMWKVVSVAHMGPTITADLVEAFAAAVAQQERDECARICDRCHMQGPNGAGQAADQIRRRTARADF